MERISWRIGTHLGGLNKGPLTAQQVELINELTMGLAKHLTGRLIDHRILVSNRTILSNVREDNDLKTANYFAWGGSDLLTLPKMLVLPMVIPPNDWVLVPETGTAHSGGDLLSSFTNVSYQGYLDTLTTRLHYHFLHLKQCDTINLLQNVPFEINTQMLHFLERFKRDLTENEIVLLSNK
jgi:hypothetical protein